MQLERMRCEPNGTYFGTLGTTVGTSSGASCWRFAPNSQEFWILFPDQLCRGQFPQLVIDQRQKLLGSGRIAGVDLREDAGDVGHVPILRCQARSRKSQPVTNEPLT
jgi:hypothetical protein